MEKDEASGLFAKYFKKLGPKESLDDFDFKNVKGSWIIRHKSTKLIGSATYAIVSGEKVIRVFPSAVPPKRVEEALDVLGRGFIK